MQTQALAPDRSIGFEMPGRQGFLMDEQGTRIEHKLDTLLQQVNQMLGAQPLRDQEVADLKRIVANVQTEQSKQKGMMDLVRWVVPALGLGAGAGGGYLMQMFGGG